MKLNGVANAPLTTPDNLSSRRTTFMFIKTLLWKNWLLKKRHYIATFLEIALPCAFILLMGALRHLTDDVNVPSGWSSSEGMPGNATQGTSYNLYDTIGFDIPSIPSQLPRFYMHETSMTGMLLGLGTHSIADGLRMEELSSADLQTCVTGITVNGAVSTDPSSPNAVPSACRGKVIPYKIAIAPSTAFTRDYFMATMDLWYPRIQLLETTRNPPQIPSLRDSFVFYDTAEALEAYVKSHDYGSSLQHPKIEGAIVFNTFPSDLEIGQFQSIEYTIRMNSTLGRRGVAGIVPRTNGDPPAVRPFAKELQVGPYASYTVGGFMTLQTLVTRFVACMPIWSANTKTTTGECQRKQATSISTPTLDARLLSSLNEDVRIQLALSVLRNTSNTTAGVVGQPSSLQLTDVLGLASPTTREALLKPLRQAPQPYLGAAVAPMPVNAYTNSPFYDQVKDVFALVFILAYLYCTSRILIVFIQEKESRIREYMKILGVQEKAIIISWYLTYAMILCIGSIIQALVGRLGLFEKSSLFIIFLFFYLFGLSVLSFGFLISTIFSKARVGAFVGMFVFFLMYFVSTAFTPQTSEQSKSIGSLLSPVALSLGAKVLSNLESTGEGINFSNLTVASENFRFSTCLFFFLLDSIVYTILGLYFEKVIPKEYGTTLPWYYPLVPSYWCKRTRVLTEEMAVLGEDYDPSSNTVILEVNAAMEGVSSELREQERTGEALSVQRLRKVFSIPGGEKIAVKGMNLVMYKDQITCLLGHNGAGKTTLISMLTGMLSPSSGTATFRGLSFIEDMEEIRQSLGICFQHDVLFPDLTVEEHLRFFARIKGYTEEALEQVVSKQIGEVGLTEKRHVLSSELSGGMKRKLSVAVSLLGDSCLVFLDEPTSGMDPYSRRSTWEILLNNRNDRVMVLTTHFMDEADILGDRIAIMSEGELRCCGSSLFLKNRYGAGYNLTMVKDVECNDSVVIDFITSFVSNAQVLSNVGSEIAFQLPLDSSYTFASMFTSLDEQLSTLKVLNYGISVTTLEEVFIKVAEAGDEEHQHTLHPATTTSDTPVLKSIPQGSLFFAHLHALLLKRFRVAKRDRRMLIFSTILPILLLLAGLLLLQGTNLTESDPSIPLNTDAFSTQNKSPTPFYCQVETTDQWCSTMMGPNMYTGARSEQLTAPIIPTPSYRSDRPTVFDVTYNSPTINASDVTGYTLRMGEALYNRGYGKNGVTPVNGQYGAYVVHSESNLNVLAYNLFVNTTATHGAAIFKALVDQALYRFIASNGQSNPPNVDLKVNSYPLPLTASSKALYGSFLSFTSCLFIVIAFSFFPASIVTFIVKEKQSEHNAKHQQLVSGVSLSAFWLSNYLFDLLTYIMPLIAAIILIQVFDITALTGHECVACTSQTFPAVVLLFVFFGLAICPFTYCLSYLFHEHASAQMFTRMINLVFGVVLMVVSFILDIVESTKEVNKYLVFVWRLSPLFSLGNGLLRLTLNEIVSILNTDKQKKSPFSSDLAGWELFYLVFTAIVFSMMTVGIDYSMTFPRFKHLLTRNGTNATEEEFVEDEDVVSEADRVLSGQADHEVVVLKRLRKVYPGGKVAVRDLSFGLKRGECFGFLGINGAGKTSTLKMLTGDVLPTSGTATLSGFDILTQQIEVRRQIGYCPQFDALFELLTVKEHLELYASIKGVIREELEDVVNNKIEQLNLGAFTDKLAGSLSGGNKRKLSVAIAMIGNPQIVFLDEPSTGMDPVSRRFMWDVIAGISTRSQSSTVVLTTHSMEESEALCSRVGIMVGGRMRCLGSVQHLKGRFGDGLVFDVKMIAPSHEEMQELMDRVFEEDTIVTRENLLLKCRVYGNEAFASRVVASHSTGYSLAAAMEREGFIRAQAFCTWCLEETRFDDLNEYLCTHFHEENVQLMERQNDFCRFKLCGNKNELKLSNVFAIIEKMKHQMHIREYSISQTTLEQIFNYFASQQVEELGKARGMYQTA